MNHLAIAGIVLALGVPEYAHAADPANAQSFLQAASNQNVETTAGAAIGNSRLMLAQANGTCSGPGDNRWPYDAEVCFNYSPYVQRCTNDGSESGTWVQTSKLCHKLF